MIQIICGFILVLIGILVFWKFPIKSAFIAVTTIDGIKVCNTALKVNPKNGNPVGVTSKPIKSTARPII